jgi:hypothetical protein
MIVRGHERAPLCFTLRRSESWGMCFEAQNLAARDQQYLLEQDTVSYCHDSRLPIRTRANKFHYSLAVDLPLLPSPIQCRQPTLHIFDSPLYSISHF